jgi:hypothetical protein
MSMTVPLALDDATAGVAAPGGTSRAHWCLTQAPYRTLEFMMV